MGREPNGREQDGYVYWETNFNLLIILMVENQYQQFTANGFLSRTEAKGTTPTAAVETLLNPTALSIKIVQVAAGKIRLFIAQHNLCELGLQP